MVIFLFIKSLKIKYMSKFIDFTKRVITQIGCDTDKYVFLRIQKPYLRDNEYLDLLIENKLEWVEEEIDKGSYIYNSLDCSLQLKGTSIFI